MSRLTRPRTALLAFACLALAPGLRAQEDLEFHSCTGHAGGGVVAINGSDSKYLNSPNGVLEAGGGVAVTPRLALLFDFMYQENGVTKAGLNTLSPPPDSGTARFENVIFNPTLVTYATRNYNLYALGGFGWLQRTVKFTNPNSTAKSLAHPGGIPAMGGESADSGVFDFGVGVNRRVTRGGLRVFAEVRYLHGVAENSQTSLLPITAGIRW